MIDHTGYIKLTFKSRDIATQASLKTYLKPISRYSNEAIWFLLVGGNVHYKDLLLLARKVLFSNLNSAFVDPIYVKLLSTAKNEKTRKFKRTFLNRSEYLLKCTPLNSSPALFFEGDL